MGTGGTVVIPAPRRDAAGAVPRRRVGRLPGAVRDDPSGVDVSRLLAYDMLSRFGLPGLWAEATAPLGPPLPAAGTAGARPQTSQYPSAIVPVQPGCRQRSSVLTLGS